MVSGICFLALLLATAPAAAQVSPDSDPDSGSGSAADNVPLDALVLVLNLVSSTHARPATGVVLSAAGETALVLVPANFVSAGDEIIVLDGGNDIARNGRASRTVARSAEAGLALLEVEGLSRTGTAVSGDAWPGPESSTYQFVAWPDARALVEGAALVRQTLHFSGSELSPEPQLAGPVFDSCGNLAAFGTATGPVEWADNESMLAFLASWNIDTDQQRCADPGGDTGPQVQPDSSVEEQVDPVDEPRDAGAKAMSDNQAPVELPEDRLSSLGLSDSQKLGLVAAWILLSLAAWLLYVRRQKKKAGHFIVLERHEADGRRFQHRFRIDPGGTEAVFDRQGVSLVFRMTENGVLVGQPESEEAGRMDLLVEGTPCMAGERFLVRPGQHFRIGHETFRFDVEIVGPVAGQENQ